MTIWIRLPGQRKYCMFFATRIRGIDLGMRPIMHFDKMGCKFFYHIIQRLNWSFIDQRTIKKQVG